MSMVTSLENDEIWCMCGQGTLKMLRMSKEAVKSKLN